jgi:hypothetical protein
MEGLLTQTPDPPAEPGVPPPADPSSALPVDAMNGFNELGCWAMLWTIRHRWAAGAQFAFNCYRQSAQLILHWKGKPGYTLLSAEGVTQDDPLSILYGLVLVPLADTLCQALPEGQLQGRASKVAQAMSHLPKLALEWGSFPKPAKSIFVCDPDDRPGAKAQLDAFGFKFVDGSRHVGGFLGTEAALLEWLEPQIVQWVRGVEALAKVARRYPQTA